MINEPWGSTNYCTWDAVFIVHLCQKKLKIHLLRTRIYLKNRWPQNSVTVYIKLNYEKGIWTTRLQKDFEFNFRILADFIGI